MSFHLMSSVITSGHKLTDAIVVHFFLDLSPDYHYRQIYHKTGGMIFRITILNIKD